MESGEREGRGRGKEGRRGQMRGKRRGGREGDLMREEGVGGKGKGGKRRVCKAQGRT